MTDWSRVIAQYRRAYRRRTAAQAVLAVMFAAGLAAASAWRLTPPWSLALGAAAAVWAGTAAWTGWQRWRRAGESIRRLDDALGLKQRLVTVQEFAQADPPPPLLGALLEDAEQRVNAGAMRLPPRMPRGTLVAAVVLLALWLWPRHLPSLQQLASRPRETPSTDTPESVDQPDQAQQQAAQDQGGASQQQGGGSSGPQAHDDASQQPQPGQHGQQPQAADQQSGQGQPSQAAASKDGKARQGQEAKAQGQGGSAKARGKTQQQQTADAAQGQAGASTQMSAAQQDAMKADIQRMLQELSGELQQMELQLANADAPRPAPGTGSDDQLFGGQEPLPQAPGTNPVPIQLKTDEAKTKSPRTGGGVGQASGRIDTEAPRAVAEDAALSGAPTAEEAAAARQPIPPEYRGAFERLQPGAQESQ